MDRRLPGMFGVIRLCVLTLLPCRMIPFSLGAALMSAASGIIVSKTGDYRWLMMITYAVFCLGYGLMTMLDDQSSKCVCEVAEICRES